MFPAKRKSQPEIRVCDGRKEIPASIIRPAAGWLRQTNANSDGGF